MSIQRKDITRLMRILDTDRKERLLRLDAYLNGVQDDPYMPNNADLEYRLLAKRATTNVMPFVLSTPMQALYVDSFRPGARVSKLAEEAVSSSAVKPTPEWDHWQYSRLGARQHAIYRGAGTFGHSFTVTERDHKGKLHTRGLSALRTSALFEDPANDIVPTYAFTVKAWPHKVGEDEIEPGVAYVYDDRQRHTVHFKSLLDEEFQVVDGTVAHGADENPVTRFACMVDLDGRTYGLIEPLIELQNRLNQTVFDLLIVQSFASFKIRTVSGMAPPVKMQAIDAEGNPTSDPDRIEGFEPVLDDQGRMIPDDVNLNAKRMFWAEDENVKFGTLDETPLDGFLAAIELAFQHIAALSQTPPHHLLGKIANISADALEAVETALRRKVEELKSSFGESWERVFRLVMAMEGHTAEAEDDNGEVLWRDLDSSSLSASADALGKLHDQLGVPARGLWDRIPGASAGEVERWEQLADSADPTKILGNRLQEATNRYTRPNYRNPDSVDDGSRSMR